MQDVHGSNQEQAPTGSAPATSPGAQRQELRYRFECETIDEFGALYAPDISRGGIFIRTNQVLPLASPVKVELLLADETPFITADGLVFWTRAASDNGMTQGEPGMGIRFTRMSQDSHRNLTRILAVKQAEDWIRAAEAAAELEAESRAQVKPEEAIDEVHTAVARLDDLRAVVAKAASPAAEPAAAVQASDAAVTAGIPVESDAPADTTPTPDAAPEAPRAFPRSLSRPLPELPDWAFASTRFSAEAAPPVVAVVPAAGDGGIDSDRSAVPTHVPDLRDASFGAPGSIATLAVTRESKAAAPSTSGLHRLQQHTGLRLVLGAALVLVVALALAPRSKGAKSAGGRTRVGAVVTPRAQPAHPGAGAAASKPAPSYPMMFGPEPAPAYQQVVSSR